MSAAEAVNHDAIHELAVRLKELQQTLEHMNGTLIQEITNEAEYDKALALLDELTESDDGSKSTERVIDMLCASIKRYEDTAPQFTDINERVSAIKGVDILKFLMKQNGLTGSDLPEIGDKTVVSRTLNNKRILSSLDIQRLAQRFHLDPGAFYPIA